MVTVDLRARVFPLNHRVYRLFPGFGYRHYLAMREGNVVFLDLPNLPAPGARGYPLDTGTLQAFVRAEQLSTASFLRREDREARVNEIRARDLSQARWSQRRRQTVHWANALYHTAQPGDIVVVPGDGSAHDLPDDQGTRINRTMIGEIVGQPERWTAPGSAIYADANLLVRRVKWLGEINEFDLPISSRRTLRTQNALVQLPADDLKNVLGAAYKNVIVGDEFLARFMTENHEFSARQGFEFQAFAMAVVAAYDAGVNGGEIEDDLGLSFYDLGSVAQGEVGDLIPEQDTSIHSPGYTTLKARRNVPFVISILFAMALTADAQPIRPDGTVDVALINTESEQYDPCDAGLEADVERTLAMIGYDRWAQACRAAQRANAQDGFEPMSRVSE